MHTYLRRAALYRDAAGGPADRHKAHGGRGGGHEGRRHREHPLRQFLCDAERRRGGGVRHRRALQGLSTVSPGADPPGSAPGLLLGTASLFSCIPAVLGIAMRPLVWGVFVAILLIAPIILQLKS